MQSDATSQCYGVLIPISRSYSPVKERLHTCYAPVRRSPAVYCYTLLPLDLHVLGLPLALILSQDQTLHCMFEFILTVMHSCISYRNFIWNWFLIVPGIKPTKQLSPLSYLLQYFKELSVYNFRLFLSGFQHSIFVSLFLKGCKCTHDFNTSNTFRKIFFQSLCWFLFALNL